MKQLITILILLASIFTCHIDDAVANEKITVNLVYSEKGQNVQSFIDAVVSGINSSEHLSVEPISIDEYLVTKKRPIIIVTVGTLAALKILELKQNIPVICVLIPKVSFDEIVNRTDSQKSLSTHRLTAIFLDQPLERQISLVTALLPNAKKVGIMLGENTANDYTRYRKTIKSFSLIPVINKLDHNSNFVELLNNTLSNSNVLIPVLDPQVFNRRNSQDILLTAYRYQVPLIGVSPAYLNAGAICALYSTPDQIAKQIIHLLDTMDVHNIALPDVSYPIFYTLRINKQVARSFYASTVNESVIMGEIK
jgi:putative ABC transport system substrate-binding protein